MKRHWKKAVNSFRKNGFELISPRFNHMRNFLTCLPFMAGKGLTVTLSRSPSATGIFSGRNSDQLLSREEIRTTCVSPCASRRVRL